MDNIPRAQDEFFILLERVGTKGKYQRYLFLLFFGLWFITAFIILSPAFLLLPNQFSCPNHPDQQQCNAFVCSKPQSQWHDYQSTPILNSLITEYGDYHCGQESNIALYKMVLFGGIFIGYFVFMYFSDNLGRRIGMILTSVTSCVGFVLISFSSSMGWACLGLLLAGAGCQSNMRINLSIMNEMVDYSLRQKYSLILQCSFGVGGMGVALAYYYFRDWRMVTHFCCTIPSIIFMLIIFLFLEETPNHLLKKGSTAVLKSLQRIAAINGFQCTITQSDVLKVIDLKNQHANSQPHIRHTFSVFDLFKYKSLRHNTTYLAALFFLVSAIYIGPSSAIDQFQLNIFILQALLSISEIIAYPIACIFIAQSKRKNIGIKCFFFCALFNFTALLIPSDGCDLCFWNITKIFLMFLSRFCIAYYYGVLFIYVVEIYPEQIRTIGFGSVSAIGALGALATQKVLQVASSLNQDPLAYFGLFGLICVFVVLKLPETQGLPLQIQIIELRVHRQKKSYEPALQSSMDISLQLQEEPHSQRD